MSAPTVAAVLLVNGREEMTRKAVECVRAQTYRGLSLTVLDSGKRPVEIDTKGIFHVAWVPDLATAPIGQLRNYINSMVGDADIIAHFDSDDISNPHRIEEQVALMQSTGADVVGYHEMLFWREPRTGEPIHDSRTPYFPRQVNIPGETWLYTGEILGTSLCYKRSAWEKSPFRAKGWNNEDFGFVCDVRRAGGDIATVSSLSNLKPIQREGEALGMVCRIHAGNASNPSYSTLENHPQHWRRVTEFDSYCRKVMELC